MSLFLKNKKKQCILVFAFLILFASLFSIKKSFSLIEDGTHYALGTKGSTIFVYNSTPHYILEASKIYIILGDCKIQKTAINSYFPNSYFFSIPPLFQP